MAVTVKEILYYGARLAIFITSNIYCLVAYIVWMTLLSPLRILVPMWYWRIERTVFYWLETVCVSWVTFGGYKVFECGDDISSLHNKKCLLLPNHQSTGDVPMIMLALHDKKTVVSQLLWVVYKLYKWTNFGMVCQHREDFFIDVGKSVRDSEMAKFTKHLKESFPKSEKKWIIVFPEGGFLCRNQESNQRYAKKNNLPVLQHVLLPRVGAVKAVFDTLGEQYDDIAGDNACTSSSRHSSGYETLSKTSTSTPSEPSRHNNDSNPCIEWVVDMTIAYKDKQPLELLGMSIGYDPRKDVLLHWRTYRVKDIPRDDKALTAWLYQRYIEKEQMLDDYYKYGKIPASSTESAFPQLQPRYLQFDTLYQILAHIALFTLFYLQYVLILKPIMSLMSIVLGYVFFFL